jgi:hypothetical protein
MRRASGSLNYAIRQSIGYASQASRSACKIAITGCLFKGNVNTTSGGIAAPSGNIRLAIHAVNPALAESGLLPM